MVLALLRVVGQQPLEVPVKNPDAGDDLAGSRCPREGFRVVVPVLDVLLDCLDEDAEGGECAAPDRLPGDDVEPDFYLVQPGTAGRREVKVTFGCVVSQASTSSPLWVDRLSRTTWISCSPYRATTGSPKWRVKPPPSSVHNKGSPGSPVCAVENRLRRHSCPPEPASLPAELMGR